MAEKGKSRGASAAKPRADKSRTPGRAQSRQLKKPKAPSRTPTQASSSPDAAPREPLDVGPILEDLLERVLTRSALAAAARQRVPFTVRRARDAVLFVAEWRFPVRDPGDPRRDGDPGDPERDGVWSEDEEPQSCRWDSWTPGAVPVCSEEEDLPEDLSVTSEAETPLSCPDEVPEAVVDLAVALSQSESSSAATASEEPEPEPEPARPEPPTSLRAPGRATRPYRARRPRPTPPDAAAPAPAVQESRGAAAKVGERAPPTPPSSRPSLASVRRRSPFRGTGVPRLGARRGAARWVMPEVKVLDVSAEPERARSAASRSRLVLSGSAQTLPGAGRVPRGEPQLCDPWLASARLAPGVTVRWGGSERRGPPPAGGGDGEREDEATRRAEKELKPILPYPECRISEYGEAEEEREIPPGTRRQLPGILHGAVPAPWGPLAPRGYSGSPVAPRLAPDTTPPGLAPDTAPRGDPGARGSLPELLKKPEINKNH